MKCAFLAILALLTSTASRVDARGRHSWNNPRHVARSPSPWSSDYEPPQAPSSGYNACVQQCMGANMSPNMSSEGAMYPQAGYDSSPPAAQSSDAIGASILVPVDASPTVGAYGTLSGMVSSLPAAPVYGSPPPVPTGSAPSSGPNSTGLVAGPYQVVVAPKQGDLRMVPFNINVPAGENVTLYGEICNASQAAGAWKSGMQEAGFELPVEVSSNATQTYFCAVPNHCRKGMFGLINGLTVAVPEGSFGEAMPIMAANDSGLASMWNETKVMCKDSPSAWSWGNTLATSQIPDWALPMAMENILATRQFLATQPQGVSNASSSATATGTGEAASPSNLLSSAGSISTRVGLALSLSTLSSLFALNW